MTNLFEAINNSQKAYDDLRYQEIVDWVNAQPQWADLSIELSFLVLGWELTLIHERRSYPLAAWAGYMGNKPTDSDIEEIKNGISSKIEKAMQTSFADWSSRLINAHPSIPLVARDYALWLDIGKGFEPLKWAQYQDKIHGTGLHSGYYSQPCNPCSFTEQEAIKMIQDHSAV
jgi:hypothetical protein